MAAKEQIEAKREHIRGVASGWWRESAAVVQLPRPSFKYDVEGRNADGSIGPKPKLGAKGVLRIIAAILLVILLLPLLLIYFALGVILDYFDLEIPDLFGKENITQVSGGPQSGAVSFADAIRAAGKKTDLWLAWSHSHLAVLASSPQEQVVWQSQSPARPSFKPSKEKISWPDGSSILLPLSKAEQKRIKSTQGRP